MATKSQPRSVDLRDVTPRDGLQGERAVSVAERAHLVTQLADAGLRDIEVGSFVSPKAVPSMAGADEVIELIGARDDVRWWALVPNRRGVDLARVSRIDALTLTISASDGYSRKNVHRSTDEAIAGVGEIVDAAAGCELDAVISCAFGSPFEDVTLRSVADVVDRVRAVGVDRLTLADTTGAATPRRVARVLGAVGCDVGLHLHDTRGTALANALAGLDAGVTRFDTSVGGLGGSPFAPGAGGNLATEDLVLVLEDSGIDTGVDLDALIRIAEALADLVGHPVPGRTAAAGALPHFDAG
ncbi:MAG TPA: hydroxymethylglutaryl-CoA lyase [Acidimicrobiales bacterium]|nr:hydroxymethylglutaryl-CoA lyase [Acidimicrobiales bacterium]